MGFNSAFKGLIAVVFAKIEKNEMGGACSGYGGWERRIKG